MTPLEFYDYIFDRYAFLGLTQSASDEDIRVALRTKRAQVHPDKLTFLSAELQAQAERTRDLLDSCATILQNPTHRAAFDNQLALFVANRPTLVSTDGIPRVSLAAGAVDLVTLMSAPLSVDEASHSARDLSGYKPGRVAALTEQFSQNPQDLMVRDLLRDALSNEYVYLNAMAQVHWGNMGVHGIPLPTNMSLEARDSEYQSHKTLMKAQAVARLTHAQQLLENNMQSQLLLPAPSGISENWQPATAISVAHVAESFDQRVASVDANQERLLAVTKSLCKVSRVKLVRKGTGQRVLIAIVTTDPDTPNWYAPDVPLTSADIVVEWADRNSADLHAQVATPKHLNAPDATLIYLESNIELGHPLLEAFEVFQDLLGSEDVDEALNRLPQA